MSDARRGHGVFRVVRRIPAGQLLLGIIVGVASTVVAVLILDTLEGPSRTETRIYAPAPIDGFTVAHETDASCFESVFAVEAYRCGADDGFMYDPCRPAADLTNGVYCAISPWDPPVLVRTVRPLREGDPIATSPRTSLRTIFPWAIELSNGRRCVFMSGATWTVAGQRVNYDCRPAGMSFGALNDPGAASERRDREFVLGTPDRTTHPWVVSFFTLDKTATEQVMVYRAWF